MSNYESMHFLVKQSFLHFQFSVDQQYGSFHHKQQMKMIIHISGWSNACTIVFGDCASQRVWFQSFSGAMVRMQCERCERFTPKTKTKAELLAKPLASYTQQLTELFLLFNKAKCVDKFQYMGCDNMKKK